MRRELFAPLACVLALSIHRRVPRGADAIAGIVAVDDPEHPIVAGYRISSWLRGPRGVARPFVVTTPHGDVPVPAVWIGAAIVIASGLYLFARERRRL